MYESVTMVNMKFLVSSATVFSKQDARGDERVSALRQDGEDFQSKEFVAVRVKMTDRDQ